MGELLDRAFQRQLLTELRDIYPKPADVQRSWPDQVDNRLLVNMSYLAEHGLIEIKTSSYHSGEIALHHAKINARGMDFIADDGGLSAILGVVTIKLHEDTIRDLLISKVQASDAETSVKDHLVAKLKALPADALASITEKALGAGLDRMPNVATWLSPLLGG